MPKLLVDEWTYTVCKNPLCRRVVKRGIDYCCGGCSWSHQRAQEGDSFDPHHSEGCDKRHAERGDAPDSWSCFS